MKSLLVAAVVFALAPGLGAGPRHCTFRVYIEASSRDGSVFAQPVRSITGKGRH